MTANYEDIVAQALALPLEQRVRLARELHTSLDAEEYDDPAEVQRLWDEEIARRIAAMKRGEMEFIDAKDAVARARAQLKR